MIQSIVQIVALREHRNDVLELLFMLNGATLATPGCLRCCIYQDLREQDSFAILQEWECENRLQQFVRSSDFSKVLALLDLAKEPPEVRFNTISATSGMEFIQQVKAVADSQQERE